MSKISPLGYHYRVRKTSIVEDYTLRQDPCIVIADDDTGAILKTTPWANYVLYPKTRDSKLHVSNLPALYAITQFLNYVFIDNYDKYKISSLSDLTIEIVVDFLNKYAVTKTKSHTYPLKNSVDQKRKAVSNFLLELCEDKNILLKNISKPDLVSPIEQVYSNHEHHLVQKYKIPIRYMEKEHTIPKLMRDMPLAILERFIDESHANDPEITLAIILMAYAGLRVSEVCNLRRPDSCHAPNFLISYGESGDPCDGITINLSETRILRSDKKAVGGNKRPRNQIVSSEYKNMIIEAYEEHLKITQEKAHEAYGPLFLCKYKSSRTGKYQALTKNALRNRLIRLFFNHVLPSLENDANPDLRQFYKQMKDHSWGPHSYRHWFTVSLVLQGYSRTEIMTLRGDKSPSSADAYLEGKGELNRRHKLSNENLGRMIYNPEEDAL